jgi:hypothetical protein
MGHGGDRSLDGLARQAAEGDRDRDARPGTRVTARALAATRKPALHLFSMANTLQMGLKRR